MNNMYHPDVREKFEEWIQTTSGWKTCKNRGKPMYLRQNADGNYNDFRVNDRWWAWKAAIDIGWNAGFHAGLMDHADKEIELAIVEVHHGEM